MVERGCLRGTGCGGSFRVSIRPRIEPLVGLDRHLMSVTTGMPGDPIESLYQSRLHLLPPHRHQHPGIQNYVFPLKSVEKVYQKFMNF